MKKFLLTLFICPLLLNAQSWDYQKTYSHFHKAQLRGLTGEGINIFMLDVGCNTIGTEGIDATWVNPTGGYDFYDGDIDFSETGNHGTATTSQVARSSIAIAPAANVYMMRIGASVSDPAAIIAAVDSILNFVDPVTGRGADIVNISGQFTDAGALSAIESLVAADIVVFAAAGDSHDDAETVTPASLTGVVAVNSYPYDGIAFHKNYIAPSGGHGIDISMGGRSTEGIYSNGTYGDCYGTSFSCTLASGFMAIYLEQAYKSGSKRTRNQIKDFMLGRAIKQKQTSYFGRGYLSF